MARVAIHVSEETAKIIRAYQREKGTTPAGEPILTLGQAADKLLHTAKGRRNALKRYADRQK